MAFNSYTELGFSEEDVEFARKTFYRDCPGGRCSKRKFLTFIRKSYIQKCNHSSYNIIRSLQNYRHVKKYFSMMFDVYDRNHDGTLDFYEYMYALSSITGNNPSRTIETLFEFFDVHNQGYITRKEFNSRKKVAAKFLGEYKPGIKESFLYDQAFNAIDKDKDDRISKEEFIEWYLKDNLTLRDEKPVKSQRNLSKISSTLTNIKGYIKTSSLQQYRKKSSADIWVDKPTNNNIETHEELPPTDHVDGYLLRIYNRARSHFNSGKPNLLDDKSDSGVCTTISSLTTSTTDGDFDSNILPDIDENEDFELNKLDDPDTNVLYQALEAAVMETLLELRHHRLNNNCVNVHNQEDEQIQTCRL